MTSRSQPAQLLIYFGAIATGMSVIAVGLMAVVYASTAVSPTGTTDKTNLELQVESSREIRKALATQIVIPPLPPITARLAHAPSAVSRKNVARVVLPEEARTAMAMQDNELGPPRNDRYFVADRHAAY